MLYIINYNLVNYITSIIIIDINNINNFYSSFKEEYSPFLISKSFYFRNYYIVILTFI